MVISKALPIKFYAAGNTYNQGIDSVAEVMGAIFNQKYNATDTIVLQFYDTDRKDYRLYVYNEAATKLGEVSFTAELLNGLWFYSLSFNFSGQFTITNDIVNLKIVEVFTEIEGAVTDLMETAAGTLLFIDAANLNNITADIDDLSETTAGEVVNGFPEFIAKGTADEDTTASSVDPVYMGSVLVGDLLLMQVINVQTTVGSISTPSGFTLLAQETMTWGTVAWFYRIADSSESGAVNVSRSGSGNQYMLAQIYQIRHYGLVLEDSDANSAEGDVTAIFDALTVAGEVRSLVAMLTTYDGSTPAAPTGYTLEATDSSTLISGTVIKLFIKENVSAGSLISVAGASYNGWATMHLSTHNS